MREEWPCAGPKIWGKKQSKDISDYRMEFYF